MNPKPISFEIDPVCVPFDKNGEEREQQNCVAFGSHGWYMPCCWCDQSQDTRNNYMDMYSKHLHASTGITPREVLESPEWQNFFKVIFEDPQNSSHVCQKYCGIINYDDGTKRNVVGFTDQERRDMGKDLEFVKFFEENMESNNSYQYWWDFVQDYSGWSARMKSKAWFRFGYTGIGRLAKIKRLEDSLNATNV